MSKLDERSVPRELPRAAYVHIPFCRHHCGYCNFTVVAGRDDLIDDYLRALEVELSWLRQPRQVATRYLGGGTPSHLNLEQFERLLQILDDWLPLADSAEFTVEANPEDVTGDWLMLLRKRGGTRISLGAQSFQPDQLAFLERAHSAERIHEAVASARQFDFHVALDLIFAVPDATIETWRTDLDAVCALRPHHVSTYGLTIEKGTPFWNRQSHQELSMPDEELQRVQYLMAIDVLTAASYEHYEVSNFALCNHRSIHNQVYWNGEPYLAAGAGASRYTDGRRETNHRSVTTYLRKIFSGQSPVAEQEALPPRDRALEALVLGLRLREGIDDSTLESRTGFTIESLCGAALQPLAELGLIEYADDRLKLSREGLLVSDSIFTRLLSA